MAVNNKDYYHVLGVDENASIIETSKSLSRSRIISLIISIGYLIAAYIFGREAAAVRMLLFLVLPLGCIWYSDELGSWTGMIKGHLVTCASLGCLVVFMGWVLLCLPIIMGLIIIHGLIRR